MIEESARIVGLEGEFAWVESERTTTCGSCAARRGCGTGAIARVLGRKRLRLRVVNSIDADIGDRVVIGIPESGVVRGSLAVYAVPLAGLFAGALAAQVAGSYLAGSEADWPAMVGALAGLLAGLAWLRHFSRASAADTAFQPVALRREWQLPVN
ncbi:MAG: SoxR reducing system RseC family protein [Thiohalobacterales bacterium]|nr:SoxR reducing system RseC family protein [Thiohalobacterales bacterium]